MAAVSLKDMMLLKDSFKCGVEETKCMVLELNQNQALVRCVEMLSQSFEVRLNGNSIIQQTLKLATA